MSILLVRHNPDGSHEIKIYSLESPEESFVYQYKFTESGILLSCNLDVGTRFQIEYSMQIDIDNGFFKPYKRYSP